MNFRATPPPALISTTSGARRKCWTAWPGDSHWREPPSHRAGRRPGPPRKCENLQRTGSFKLRGAYVRISGLAVERAAGVVAASAGNHAQALALASSSSAYAPRSSCPSAHSPAQGRRHPGVRGRGAAARPGRRLRPSPPPSGTRRRPARSSSTPSTTPDIIAGQGTVGLEILEQCPEVRTIVLGIGGGGFAAGVAVAVKALRSDIRIVGVQAEGAALATLPSLAAGYPVSLDAPATMADGISVGRPGDVPFALVESWSTRSARSPRTNCPARCCSRLERAKLVVEPPGPARWPRCSATRRRSAGRWSPCCPAATSTRS